VTNVRWTAAALADLDEILAYTDANYPALSAKVELRIRAVIQRVTRLPRSARRMRQDSDVRVVPVLRYPFKVFYRAAGDEIEILHIHHTARDV
jgi:plasmid stabilization system protein ParE